MSGAVVSGEAAVLEYQKWICSTKRKFASKEDAAACANRRLANDQTLRRLCIYLCPACGQFHLTKKKTRLVASMLEARQS